MSLPSVVRSQIEQHMRNHVLLQILSTFHAVPTWISYHAIRHSVESVTTLDG